MMREIKTETGICFFRVPRDMRLSELLLEADYSPLTPDVNLAEWLDYGCIYVNGLRRREDVAVTAGEIIRVHTRRKKFLSDVRLRDLIVEETPDFLVLDKPAGLPTHPTLDNYLENAKSGLERELEIPIYTTHRLDIPTQGLLIFAKTPDAQRSFNRQFALGRVEKIYRALNPREVPLGLHTHYMDPNSRVPKVLVASETAGWWKCQLEVLKLGTCPSGHWHEIKLLTGKTHQIRAQMAFLGAPILGDNVYAGESATVERIALECFRLSFAFRSRTFAISRPLSLVAPHLYECSPTSIPSSPASTSSNSPPVIASSGE